LHKHCLLPPFPNPFSRENSGHKADDKDNIEKQIEILQHALQTLDFGKLRSAYPELTGHCDDHIELSVNDQNQIIIRINGKKIGVKGCLLK